MAQIDEHPGWIGRFTRERAPGAYPNGARVRKRGSKPDDAHRNGAPGTVLGSLRTPFAGRLAYFVEFEDRPRCAAFVTADRVTCDT